MRNTLFFCNNYKVIGHNIQQCKKLRVLDGVAKDSEAKSYHSKADYSHKHNAMSKNLCERLPHKQITSFHADKQNLEAVPATPVPMNTKNNVPDMVFSVLEREQTFG
jgi:hypothetical protein